MTPSGTGVTLPPSDTSLSFQVVRSSGVAATATELPRSPTPSARDTTRANPVHHRDRIACISSSSTKRNLRVRAGDVSNFRTEHRPEGPRDGADVTGLQPVARPPKRVT